MTEIVKKRRIFQIAKELNISHLDIMDYLKNNGTPVESHMAPVNPEVYDEILLEFSKDKLQIERHRKEQARKVVVSKINKKNLDSITEEESIKPKQKVRKLETSFKNKNIELARSYMGINDESKLSELIFDKVFIGSCTNSRIEDLRQAANVVKGKKLAKNIIEAIVVPGSGMVKEQAEIEGLDEIFKEAGFIWRDPGCSMCLGMNPDQLKPYERCASTSNRNFEGRQGYLGRTHLMSPLMAAYTAINGTVGEPS